MNFVRGSEKDSKKLKMRAWKRRVFRDSSDSREPGETLAYLNYHRPYKSMSELVHRSIDIWNRNCGHRAAGWRSGSAVAFCCRRVKVDSARTRTGQLSENWIDEKLLRLGTTKSSCVLGRQKALVSWSNEKLLCPGQRVQFTQYLLSRIFKNSGYDFADKMRFVEEKYLTRSVFENSG